MVLSSAVKIVQINSVLNSGSTGRIAEQIGKLAISRGHDSLIAYGRKAQESASRTYHIGSALDVAAQRMVLNVFDVTAVDAGPVATATLPYALPLGLHGKFVAAPG